MAASSRLPAPLPIDVNRLPKWRDEDMLWVVALLSTRYPEETVTIASIVRDLGYRDRNDDGNPTLEYQRVRFALHAALAKNLVRRSGQRWGLP